MDCSSLNGLFLRQVLQAYQVRVTPWRATAISTLSTAGTFYRLVAAVWRAAHGACLLLFPGRLHGYPHGWLLHHLSCKCRCSLIALLLLALSGSTTLATVFFFFTIWLLTGLSMLPRSGQHQANFLPAKVSGLSGLADPDENRPW